MVFEIFTLLCCLGLSISSAFTFWPVKHGYDFYRPLVMALAGYVAGFILVLLFLYIIGFFSKKDMQKPSKFYQFLLHHGVKFLHLHIGVKTKIKGGKKIPYGQKFLLVCNHISNFDPMVMIEHWPQYKLIYVTKKENYKIPIINNLMRGACYLPVDREDPLQSLGVMKKCSEWIKSKVCSVVIFPEGTTKHTETLAPFHEGVFNVALRARCPLVVCTIKGTKAIHKNVKKPFKLSHVTIEVLRCMPYEEISEMPAKQLSDKVHEMMLENLNK